MKKLRIKNHAFFKLSNGSAALVFGKATFLLPKGLASSFTRRRDSLITGQLLNSQIEPTLRRFLNDNGLFVNNSSRPVESPNRQIPVNLAREIIEAAIQMWRPLPMLHPLFGRLRRNSPGLALAFLLEQTVFVESAYSYFRAASLQAKTKKQRSGFRQMSKDEKDHFKILCRALGLDNNDLYEHDPFPGTLAIIAYLHQLAFLNPSALAIVTALFETDPHEVESIKSFYGELEGITNLRLKPFFEHHKLDAELDHHCFWQVALEGRRSINSAEVSGWIFHLHSVKHLLELWYDSILSETDRRRIRTKVKIRDIVRPRPEVESIYVS